MGGRYALLIATSRYSDARLRELRAPDPEARRLRELLLDAEIGGFSRVDIVADESKNEIERQIEVFLGERAPDDLALLYISGHGIKNKYDRLFFAAAKTDLATLSSSSVAATWVQEQLTDSQAKAKVVLLDCCYSGVFTRAFIARSNAVELDFEGELLGEGMFVMTASNELQFAYEGDELIYGDPTNPGVGGSLFTSAVINGLETGAADLDDDGVIMAEELFAYVSGFMKDRTELQTPTMYNRVAKGNFPLAKTRAARWHGGSPGLSLPTLDALLTDVAPVAKAETPSRLSLETPIGHAYPRGGKPSVLRLNLAGQKGNLVVVGRIMSGKSTLLRTVVLGLAAIYSPRQVQFFCLDGDGRFGGLDDLPHVRAVLGTDELDEVGELLDYLEQVVTTRRSLFSAMRLTSIEDYRHWNARQEPTALEHADIFLIVDGWSEFADVSGFAGRLQTVANRGLNVGVHVVVTVREWDDLPRTIARALLGRIELLLSDPAESQIDAAKSAALPDEEGWGLHAGQQFRVALPTDEPNSWYTLVDRIRAAVDPVEAAAALGNRDDWRGGTTEAMVEREPSFLELFGIDDPDTFDPLSSWQRRPGRERYRVPFAIGAYGQVVELDLKERDRDGMGPHGLVVGAPGSGKAALLRTVILGLAVTHSPDALTVVLIDGAGGETFAGLAELPHVIGTAASLAEDPTMIDRWAEVLGGELQRRQDLLKQVGARNAWDYERMRGGEDRTPLPLLLICVDEFAELLTVRPGFADVLQHIVQVGRALRLHLLLSTRRLTEEVLRGLDASLTYRIALKTYSATDSVAAIGEPDAFELPSAPGTGYLALGRDEPLVSFKASSVSGPVDSADPATPTLLDVLVRRMREQGAPAHRIWVPPLDESPPLDALLPPITATEDRGLSSAVFAGYAGLQVPIGVLDLPFEQRRDLLWADLSGHGAVVGGHGSGKSTLLRTAIVAMALTHTPEEVQFYCIDLGSGLAPLAELPHVGTVATERLDSDLIRRTVAELAALVSAREGRFHEQGITSLTEFRSRKRRGEIADDRFGDVFLVIDGWRQFSEEHDALVDQVMTVALTGRAYGVHLLLTSGRWMDFRPALRHQLDTRFELRLNDPHESSVDRQLAANVPADRPGRGLTTGRQQYQTGLPRIDGSTDPATAASGLTVAVSRIAAAWHGPSAPPIRLLPNVIRYEDLPPPRRGVRKALIPIGIEENELSTICLDFDAEPHVMIFADNESGKTNLLRAIVRGIMTNYSSRDAAILLVDYRRTMLGVIDTDHLLTYAGTRQTLEEVMQEVKQAMQSRLPGPDVTRQDVRDRSWWNGPQLFVVVDDYDLVAPPGTNPLAPLLEFLPVAKDIGLHVVLARRMGGAARALYEPLTQNLREIGSPGFVGSGSPDEGPVWGTVAPSAQPPGRGVLVSRKFGDRRVQIAWVEPEEPEEADADPSTA